MAHRLAWHRLVIPVLLALATLALSGAAPPALPARYHRPIVAVGANRSNNWAGYNQGSLERGGVQFHSVSGTWTVPTATQHTPGEAEFSASWLGIGGG